MCETPNPPRRWCTHVDMDAVGAKIASLLKLAQVVLAEAGTYFRRELTLVATGYCHEVRLTSIGHAGSASFTDISPEQS